MDTSSQIYNCDNPDEPGICFLTPSSSCICEISDVPSLATESGYPCTLSQTSVQEEHINGVAVEYSKTKNSDGTSAVNSKEQMQKDKKPRKSKGFPCTICDHIASSSGRLKEHYSSHTGEKHLQCEVCQKRFAWRYSYRIHMASHCSDKLNICSLCNKKYCSKSSLRNHMLRAHNVPEKTFVCEECDKSFCTNSELNRHSFVHSTERPYVCEHCGNSYRFKAALVVHCKLHTGDKPFRCEFCGATFLYQSSAVNHHRIHTNEKPFQCSVCMKVFRTKRLLTSHMCVHSKSKRFKCKSCEKTFSSRSGYRVHLDCHLGLKRHVCKYCGKAFCARNNMRKHAKRHVENQFVEQRSSGKVSSHETIRKLKTKCQISIVKSCRTDLSRTSEVELSGLNISSAFNLNSHNSVYLPNSLGHTTADSTAQSIQNSKLSEKVIQPVFSITKPHCNKVLSGKLLQLQNGYNPEFSPHQRNAVEANGIVHEFWAAQQKRVHVSELHFDAGISLPNFDAEDVHGQTSQYCNFPFPLQHEKEHGIR